MILLPVETHIRTCDWDRRVVLRCQYCPPPASVLRSICVAYLGYLVFILPIPFLTEFFTRLYDILSWYRQDGFDLFLATLLIAFYYGQNKIHLSRACSSSTHLSTYAYKIFGGHATRVICDTEIELCPVLCLLRPFSLDILLIPILLIQGKPWQFWLLSITRSMNYKIYLYTKSFMCQYQQNSHRNGSLSANSVLRG